MRGVEWHFPAFSHFLPMVSSADSRDPLLLRQWGAININYLILMQHEDPGRVHDSVQVFVQCVPGVIRRYGNRTVQLFRSV
jgi:hypothetical protein